MAHVHRPRVRVVFVAVGRQLAADAPAFRVRGITVGTQLLPILWSHIPNIAMVSYTSTIPQNDIGNYNLGPGSMQSACLREAQRRGAADA